MENYNSIIGDNLKAIRTARKMSLDKVCALTGISKSMLSQIEKGTGNPSVTTLWKLANGFKISFTELINKAEEDIELTKAKDTQPILACDGKYRNFPVTLFDSVRRFESYRIEIDSDTLLEAEAHLDQTVEYVTVVNGSLTVSVNGQSFTLEKGDTLKFAADKPHAYHNESPKMTVLSMILYYPK